MARQTITWAECGVQFTILPPMFARGGDWVNTRTFWELNAASTVKSFSSLKIWHPNSPLFTWDHNARDFLFLASLFQSMSSARFRLWYDFIPIVLWTILRTDFSEVLISRAILGMIFFLISGNSISELLRVTSRTCRYLPSFPMTVFSVSDLIETCDSSMEGWTISEDKFRRRAMSAEARLCVGMAMIAARILLAATVTWKVKGFLWNF